MLDRLIDPIVGPLASRWLGHATGPAVLFWLAGAYAYLSGRPRRFACPANPASAAPWCQLPDGWVRPAALVILVAAAALGSAVLMTHAAQHLLGLLAEARWSTRPSTRWLARPLVVLHRWRRNRLVAGSVSAGGTRAAALLWRRARRYPKGSGILPTAIGNIFAAVGQRIAQRYGMDVGICWGLLTSLMPEPTQQRLQLQLNAVLLRCQALLWALLATGWAALLGSAVARTWYILGCLLAAAVAYAGTRQATIAYCDQVEDAVTLHRLAVYDALSLARPADSVAEPEQGRLVTDYLNLAPTPPLAFVPPPAGA